MHSTRAIHRSPSSTTAGRAAWAAAQNGDVEVAAGFVGSPKKAAPPSFRRKKPLALMFSVLFVTFLLGAALYFSQQGAYHDDGSVVAEDAAAKGPSIAPQEAWNPLHILTKAAYNRIPGNAYVEFTAPGLFLPIKDALNLEVSIQQEEIELQESPTTSFLDPQHRQGNNNKKSNIDSTGGSLRESFNSIWSQDRIINNKDSDLEAENGKKGGKNRHLNQIYRDQQGGEGGRAARQKKQHSTLDAAFSNGVGTPEEWSQPEGIRLLVAVTSACCTQVSLQRRAAIRRTWAALVNERYNSGTISIQFFLAQPENETLLTEWLPALEEEIIAHNDTVVLRGKDAYLNLPNKTFRMLRYALAHPREYTHVLKADDDTWVRMHKVLDYLHEKTPTNSVAVGNTATASREKEKSAVSAAAAGPLGAGSVLAGIQRKAELEKMSRDRGIPIVSEGMTLYDGSSLVQRLDQGQTDPSYVVDDIDGSHLTLAELARRANWYANKARNSIFEEEKKRQGQSGGDGGGAAEGGGKKKEGGEGNSIGDGNAGEKTGGGKRNLLQLLQLLQKQHENEVLLSNSVNNGQQLFSSRRPRLSGVYLGCIENQRGFQPIRDKTNKWYVSETDLPDSSYPHGVKYLAGWGYILSRDLVMHVVQKLNSYEKYPEYAPVWFNRIAFEDVLLGLLLHDVVPQPESHLGFRPAWRACVPDTAVRHLDVDSPRLLKALVEQDISGLSDQKPVQCSSGQFLPGDYNGWYAWRSSLTV